MKKHMWKVLSLACAAALLAGCGGGKGGKSTPQGSSSDSSSTPVVTLTIDEAIAQFLGDSELTVPSLDEYELDWDIFYSYSNQMYFIEGLASEDHEAEYLELIGETTWASVNDDTWYPVEEYGYLYADNAEDPTFVITFFDSVYGFYFDLSRYDGEAGDLDVSGIDTSWYVDYTYKGYEKTDAFPQAQLDAFLGTDKAITDLEADTYLYAASEAYTDEDGYYNPKSFAIVVEGDKTSDYAAALTAQGFAMEEVWTQTIDWDTWEYVDVLAGYQGFDADHQLVISVSLDDQENTAVAAYDFSDVYTDALTTNTDWTESEKALMTEYLGEVLPFFQMGEGYEVTNVPDETYPYVNIADNYFEDRTQDVIDVLLANGFKADDSYAADYDGLIVYVKDNKSVYMEVWPGYSNGNYFQVYYEPSRFVAATSIEIDDGAELNIVAGSIYNLTATLAPEECDSTYAFSLEENTAAASITPEGRLTIAENAEPGTDIVVTATTSEGLTDTITIHVVADVLAGITLNAESVRLSPGKTFDIEITPSPIGASLSATPTYEWIPANAATGVSVSDTGRISVAEGTEIGVQGRVVVHVGELTAELNVLIVDSAVTDHVDGTALGMTEGSSTYGGHELAADGAYYVAQCANTKNTVQIRSKNSNSGIVGAGNDGRTIKSVTLSFHTETEVPGQERAVEIYASNTAFEIEDMYSGEMEPLDKIVYDSSELTKTFTFTEKYAYVGLRSANGAVYLNSIDFVWEA